MTKSSLDLPNVICFDTDFLVHCNVIAEKTLQFSRLHHRLIQVGRRQIISVIHTTYPVVMCHYINSIRTRQAKTTLDYRINDSPVYKCRPELPSVSEHYPASERESWEAQFLRDYSTEQTNTQISKSHFITYGNLSNSRWAGWKIIIW